MTGGVIVAVTLITIGIALFLIWLSFRSFAWLEEYLCAPERGLVAKLLLVIPFLLLGIWCFILQVAIIILTLGAAASAAGSFRNWWNKGH